jgi:hypothetical protein
VFRLHAGAKLSEQVDGWKDERERLKADFRNLATDLRPPPESRDKFGGRDADSEKSTQKISALLKGIFDLAAGKLAGALGNTQRAVEKQIAKLRQQGRIQRFGLAKGGQWEEAE